MTAVPSVGAATLAALYPAVHASEDYATALRMRDSLRFAVEQFWPLIEPGTVFRPSWHIDAVCDHLEAVSRGEIRRLIINVPPRHMKSILVAVMWPAWQWLRRPEHRWLYASYSARLSTQDSVKCRRIIESAGGRLAGGTLPERVGYTGLLRLFDAANVWELTGDQNEKTKFENDRSGYRLATSVGGTATGMGGDTIVLDDPNAAADGDSETKREAVVEWIDGTMSTRLNDPQTGSVVVVQQRIHQDDATGHLLAQGGYEHLCLPAEFEPSHPFVWPDDPRREPGELLWPKHFDRAAVDDLKGKLGSRRASGQLQQNPTPSEGGMFKRRWWRRYGADVEAHLVGGWDSTAASWDMRFTDSKKTGDWVVGQYWGFHGADAYLLGMIRGRLSFVESQQALVDLAEWGQSATRPRGATLVERKANGDAIIQTLQRVVPGIIPIVPTESKQARAAAVSPMVEAGNVWLPASDHIPTPPGYEAVSVADFIEEHAAFPLAAHDDMVDALSQVLSWRRPTHKTGDDGPVVRHRAGTLTAGLASRAI